jgi:hypothetical protein
VFPVPRKKLVPKSAIFKSDRLVPPYRKEETFFGRLIQKFPKKFLHSYELRSRNTLNSQKFGTQTEHGESLSPEPKLPCNPGHMRSNRRDIMLSSHDIERVYGPDTLKIMTAAFDNAHQCLPAKFKENDHARRKLALLIMRHMERGEHNPVSLANVAVLDFLR